MTPALVVRAIHRLKVGLLEISEAPAAVELLPSIGNIVTGEVFACAETPTQNSNIGIAIKTRTINSMTTTVRQRNNSIYEI